MTRKAKYDFKVARLKRNLTISELACKMKIQPKKLIHGKSLVIKFK